MKVDVKLQAHGQCEKSGSEVLAVEAYFLVKFLDHLLELPMLRCYYDEWNGLKYVVPSQRSPGKGCRHDVHKDYFVENSDS